MIARRTVRGNLGVAQLKGRKGHLGEIGRQTGLKERDREIGLARPNPEGIETNAVSAVIGTDMIVVAEGSQIRLLAIGLTYGNSKVIS